MKTVDRASSETGRMTCEQQPIAAHIVAAKLPQSAGHEFGGDALAPGHVEIGVVQRLGDARGKGCCLRDGILVLRLTR